MSTRPEAPELVVLDASFVLRYVLHTEAPRPHREGLAILGECETGDSVALKAYETALQSTNLPTEAKSLIEQQHSQVLQAKNWVTQQKGNVRH